MAGRRGGGMNSNGKAEDEMPKAKITRESLKDSLVIFKYIKPYKGYFWSGILFISLSALSTMTFPFLIGLMIDVVSPAGNPMQKNPATAIMKEWLDVGVLSRTHVLMLIFVQLAIQMVFSFMRVYMLTQAGERTMADLRREVFGKILTLPMSFFSERRVGELSSRISADLSQIQDAVSFMLAEVVRGLVTLMIGLSILFIISPTLALVMLSVIPVIAILAVMFGFRIRKKSREAQDQLADTNTIVQESLSAISIVKAFTNEAFELKRYTTQMSAVVKTAIQNAFFRGSFISTLIFSVFGAIGFVIWFGVGLVQDGSLSSGILITFILVSGFVGGTFAGFADMFSQLQKTIGATERVREILKEEGESIYIKEEYEAKQNKLNGQVSFEKVAFSYPSRKDIEVLKNVSLSAERGQLIAIVGPSGAGKSTMASLLLRFYDPSSGTIHFDGKPALSFELSYLRSQMALVPQDVVLFGGTIYENILYGYPNASKEEVEAAAIKANAHQFIESFPEGYKTIVGERGIQLSGGQRQRIAIARAILKDPSILILDEATSSLDSESELLVQEALEKLMKDRTSFVIAHRLSTIRNADKIVVIDKGEVAEMGTHDQLIKNEHGIYRKLVELQYELMDEQ
jgi:ABC-type multidrug transport system fused ATPase/permease subunit